MTERACTKCEQVKPLDAFGVCRGRARAQCKECTNAAQALREGRSVIAPGFEPSPDIATAAPFGSPMQRACAEAFIRAGGIAEAAAELNLTPAQVRAYLSELERRAATRGWAPGSDMTKVVPEGFHVKGTSTLYGADGEIRGQWVKTARDPDDKLARLAEAVQRLAEPFAGASEPIAAPRAMLDSDLLAVYPMGDPHFGMLAWAGETGEDFDLKVAESDLVQGADMLVSLAPPAEEALVINLGDFFHTDNTQNRTTRSGHALDVDSRWAKILSVGIRAMRRVIDRALEKHARVRVICEIGNHDDHSAIMLALCLSNFYEREPRVVVDTSAEKYHWHRFGTVLIGVTHGDSVKPAELPAIMAYDRAKDWGETEHRFWYTGHVHHESVKEYRGVTVETFRTLAARDQWHHAAGYRAGRDLRLDVLHKRFGLINRHVVGISAIRSTRRE